MRTTNPTWVTGAETTAPATSTQIAKVVVTAGRIGKLYGGRVVSQEANAAGKRWTIRASIQGQTVVLGNLDATNPSWVSDYPLAIVKGNGVDYFEMIFQGTATAATIHQGSLLYDEEQIDAPVWSGESR